MIVILELVRCFLDHLSSPKADWLGTLNVLKIKKFKA